ncbi:hypothetical protein KI387_023293, partial [Taxus chinensis]
HAWICWICRGCSLEVGAKLGPFNHYLHTGTQYWGNGISFSLIMAIKGEYSFSDYDKCSCFCLLHVCCCGHQCGSFNEVDICSIHKF